MQASTLDSIFSLDRDGYNDHAKISKQINRLDQAICENYERILPYSLAPHALLLDADALLRTTTAGVVNEDELWTLANKYGNAVVSGEVKRLLQRLRQEKMRIEPF